MADRRGGGSGGGPAALGSAAALAPLVLLRLPPLRPLGLRQSDPRYGHGGIGLLTEGVEALVDGVAGGAHLDLVVELRGVDVHGLGGVLPPGPRVLLHDPLQLRRVALALQPWQLPLEAHEHERLVRDDEVRVLRVLSARGAALHAGRRVVHAEGGQAVVRCDVAEVAHAAHEGPLGAEGLAPRGCAEGRRVAEATILSLG